MAFSLLKNAFVRMGLRYMPRFPHEQKTDICFSLGNGGNNPGVLIKVSAIVFFTRRRGMPPRLSHIASLSHLAKLNRGTI